MRIVIPFAACLVGVVLCDAAPPDSSQELLAVAKAATAMLDGDLCRRIPTARAQEFLLRKDPRDPWRASDNYDVNAGAFVQTKKTLIRLARLCPSACDVNLWLPVASAPGRIQITIRNAHEWSQFWEWGVMDQETPAEMQNVLESGRASVVRKKPGMISVLAPIYDSLGDVAAIAEVVTETNPDPRENVK